jgi:hypothetical protein
MKTLIVAGILSITIVAGSTAGIVAYNACNYDELTGNYLYDGNKVAAHGTMDSAMECALMGMLPDIVIDRLGVFGAAEEVYQADRIKELNSEVKQKNKE